MSTPLTPSVSMNHRTRFKLDLKRLRFCRQFILVRFTFVKTIYRNNSILNIYYVKSVKLARKVNKKVSQHVSSGVYSNPVKVVGVFLET